MKRIIDLSKNNHLIKALIIILSSICFITTTMFSMPIVYLDIVNVCYYLLFLVCFFIIVCRMYEKRRIYWPILLVSFLGYCLFAFRGLEGSLILLVSVFLISALFGFDHIQIIRTAFNTQTFFMILAFCLSMFGLVDNHMGNAFGIIYRTDCACHLLFIILMYCYLKNGYLGWKGELILIFLSLVNFFFIGGKTTFICLIVLMIGTFWRKYRRHHEIPYQDTKATLLFRILYYPFVVIDTIKIPTYFISGTRKFHCGSFVFWSVLIILTSVCYQFLPPKLFYIIPNTGTVGSRLMYGNFAFRNIPVSLFGTFVPFFGNGGRNNISILGYFLDSSYIKILFENGLIGFLLFVGLMTYIQVRFYQKKRWYSMFLLSIVAMDCVMEHHMVDLSYNAFLLLAFADLDSSFETADTVSLEDVIKKILVLGGVFVLLGGLLSLLSGYKQLFQIILILMGIISIILSRFIGKSIIRKTITLLLVVLIPVCFYSAYRISYCPFSTLKDRPVLVIHEDQDCLFIDSIVQQVDIYARLHRDAKIIVSGSAGEQIAQRLKEDNSLKTIISLDLTSRSLEEAILSVNNQISPPERMVVLCTKPEARRVSEIQKQNGILLAEKTISLPWNLYLYDFLYEQIRFIAGREEE